MDQGRELRVTSGAKASSFNGTAEAVPRQRFVRRLVFQSVVLAGMVVGLVAADFQYRGSDVQYVAVEPVAQVQAKAGATAPVTLKFRVLEGYHVNSNKPRSELLIPTKLKLTPPLGISIMDVRYPAGKSFSLSFSPAETLSVYTGDFAVQAALKPLASAPVGAYHVTGELDYQACSDRACFPPKKLPVSFEVSVTPAVKNPKTK